MSSDEVVRVRRLLKRLVSKGSTELSPEEVMEVKKELRYADKSILLMLFNELKRLLRRQHSQIRLSCLLLMDLLFTRSVVFREMVVNDLRCVVKSILLDDPMPQPIPALLKSRARLVLRTWTNKHGRQYPKLHVACQQLNINEKEKDKRESNDDSVERSLKVWRERLRRLHLDYTDSESELDECLKEMNACLDLLVPQPGHFGFEEQEEGLGEEAQQQRPAQQQEHVEQDGGEEVDQCEELEQRQHGLVNRNQSLQIELNSTEDDGRLVELSEDNAAIVEVLRCRVHLVQNRLLPRLTAWEVVLDKSADMAVDTFPDGLVGNVKKWKEALGGALKKAMQLNMGLEKPMSRTEEDDDDDEDLVEVPSLDDAPRPSSSVSVSTTAWSCRHPLPSGRLCPRQDLVRCPLHGKIIARDAEGAPRDPREVREPKEKVPEWQDPKLLAEIRSKIGIDLTMPKKGQRLRAHGEKVIKSIKELKNTPRSRLEKRVFKKR